MLVPKSERGFTLLEVLVALIIFGIAFGAIAGIFQTALRQSTTASMMLYAQSLAEQQLVRFGTELPLIPGNLTGTSTMPSREPLAWKSRIDLATPVAEGADFALYRITIDVAAKGETRPLLTVETLKIGAAP